MSVHWQGNTFPMLKIPGTAEGDAVYHLEIYDADQTSMNDDKALEENYPRAQFHTSHSASIREEIFLSSESLKADVLAGDTNQEIGYFQIKTAPTVKQLSVEPNAQKYYKEIQIDPISKALSVKATTNKVLPVEDNEEELNIELNKNFVKLDFDMNEHFRNTKRVCNNDDLLRLGDKLHQLPASTLAPERELSQFDIDKQEHLKILLSRINPASPPHEKKLLEDLLIEFSDCFSVPTAPSTTHNCYTHKITLKSNLM
jgi:hypothetical protein